MIHALAEVGENIRGAVEENNESYFYMFTVGCRRARLFPCGRL